jgi:AraC-like DNA-binding protein
MNLSHSRQGLLRAVEMRINGQRARSGTTGVLSSAAPRVRTSTLDGLEMRVKSRGGPPLETLLSQAGLPARRELDSNSDMPLHSFAVLLDQASRSIDDECLALELAREYPVGSNGVLGYLLRNAPDFRTFAVTYCKYMPLHVDAVKVEFTETKKSAFMTWSLPDSYLGPRRPLLELAIGIFVARAKGTFVDDWRPIKCRFEFRSPTRIDRYREHFGPVLEFEAGVNRLCLRTDHLDLPNRMRPDGRLFATLRSIAQTQLEAVKWARELKGAERRDLLTRLSQYFVDQLDTGRVELENAARALEMSARELQGELRRRGTSFGTELNRVRRNLAERYLRETSLPMSEIAFLLGFSEQSAFTRAARGWFRKPPSAVRHGVD